MMGDFNSVPDAALIRMLTATTVGRRTVLRDAWHVANGGDSGPTMPSQAPTIRIDYIFVSPALAVTVALRFGHKPARDGFYPSDHLGVAAVLDTR